MTMSTSSFFPPSLQAMRRFYNSGITRDYAFRKQQLLALKRAIIRYEQEIYNALYTDLKRSKEETYATENGLLLAEINVALKNLHKWMRPRRTATNLVNLPSSSFIHYEPLGVVFIIAPWNYPLQLLLIPLVGAIAAGNCAVLKPSEQAPATAEIVEKIINKAFTPEYVKVIQGDGAEVVPQTIRSFRFDHIFYTGNFAIGLSLYQLAAKGFVSMTLELGGKSPAIIEADADINTSAKRIVLGKFVNAGQTCIAPDYVLVHQHVYEKFIEALKHTLRQFYGNDPRQSDDYGRIINERRFDTLVDYFEDGDIVAGGETDREELYIAPTVLTNIVPDATIMQEEIFGPILPVLPFSNAEEALAIIDQNPDPLSLYVFTSDRSKEAFWIRNIRFGSGCINNAVWQFANHHLPFGGIGYSGKGAYHGKHSFLTFSHAKPVMKTPVWFDPSIKYPPFGGKMKWFKRLIR
jgi:aldehyde dehydrogenase (NAD+)